MKSDLLKKVFFKAFPQTRKGLDYFKRDFFKNLRYYGTGISIMSPFKYRKRMRTALGNKVVIEGGGFLDASGGIMLGDDVRIHKGKNLLTSVNGKGLFNPIFVGNGNSIQQDLVPGAFIPNKRKVSQLSEIGKNLVFVVGTGRSGTKAMAMNINKVDGGQAYHDAFIPVQFVAMDYYNGKITKESAMKKLSEMFSFTEYVPSNYLVFSDHKYSAIIPLLNELFPEAKFINLIRKADGFINSALARGWYSDNEVSQKLENREEDLNILLRTFPKFNNQLSSEDWMAMNAFERNCWYWSSWNKMIIDFLKPIPADQVLTLRLEELGEDIFPLLEFLGITEKVHFEKHNTSAYKKLESTNWTAEMKSSYEKWCMKLMSQLYCGHV